MEEVMSLDGAYDDKNVFAKILRGELPCRKVYEDDAVLAFMDLFPQSPGHTLVVPKVAARNIFDIGEDDLAQLIVRVKKVAAGVRKALDPDGVVVTLFNGAPAGQSVFHLHFHIIPRYEGRSLRGHAGGGKADENALAEMAGRIAKAIG
jgi:histidine triad (HIT) family protein